MFYIVRGGDGWGLEGASWGKAWVPPTQVCSRQQCPFRCACVTRVVRSVWLDSVGNPRVQRALAVAGNRARRASGKRPRGESLSRKEAPKVLPRGFNSESQGL